MLTLTLKVPLLARSASSVGEVAEGKDLVGGSLAIGGRGIARGGLFRRVDSYGIGRLQFDGLRLHPVWRLVGEYLLPLASVYW